MKRVTIRYSVFAGLATLALAALVTWLVIAESSPLREYFLYDGVDLKNTWAALNLPSVIAGALVAGDPHNWNGTAMGATFLSQWFLIGFLPVLILSSSYKRFTAHR